MINLPGKVDTLQKCMQNFVNNKHFQLENILSLEDIKSLTQKAYDENIKNIDLIYKNFKNAIGDTSINSYSFEIAEVGYIISDIYERNGEFQKSVDISRHIIPIYKNAIKRKDVLINIIGSISDSIIYEKAKQFYDDIFSRL